MLIGVARTAQRHRRAIGGIVGGQCELIERIATIDARCALRDLDQIVAAAIGQPAKRRPAIGAVGDSVAGAVKTVGGDTEQYHRGGRIEVNGQQAVQARR